MYIVIPILLCLLYTLNPVTQCNSYKSLSETVHVIIGQLFTKHMALVFWHGDSEDLVKHPYSCVQGRPLLVKLHQNKFHLKQEPQQPTSNLVLFRMSESSQR